MRWAWQVVCIERSAHTVLVAKYGEANNHFFCTFRCESAKVMDKQK
jgi:hypothetical protein